MNFTDAVRELAEGRCEGIKRNEYAANHRYPGQVFVPSSSSSFQMCNKEDIADILADDWQLVNPKPVMEEVEITAYLTTFDSGDTDPILSDHVPVFPFSKGHATQSHTFKYSRPVAKKVKRRELVGAAASVLVDTACFNMESGTGMPDDAKIFAEWELRLA